MTTGHCILIATLLAGVIYCLWDNGYAKQLKDCEKRLKDALYENYRLKRKLKEYEEKDKANDE